VYATDVNFCMCINKILFYTNKDEKRRIEVSYTYCNLHDLQLASYSTYDLHESKLHIAAVMFSIVNLIQNSMAIDLYKVCGTEEGHCEKDVKSKMVAKTWL